KSFSMVILLLPQELLMVFFSLFAPTTVEYRSLPSGRRTHTLIWRNKADLEDQSFDDLFNSLKIYEAEVKSSSSASTSTQNIAFVSSSNNDSTNEPVSATTSVSAVSAKIPVSHLPNEDSLSNAIDADDLEKMDLKWKMAMLTVRAKRFLQRTGRNLGSNGPTFMGFDMSKVECYNCHRKGHFVRECRSPKDTRRNGAEAMTGVFKLKRSLPTMLLWPSYLQVLLLIMSDESLPPSPIYDRYLSDNGYHVVPPPYTGTFMPPKPDLVFNNAPINVETDQDLSPTNRPLAPIIEDCAYDSEDESETKAPQNVPSFIQSSKQVKSPRPSFQHVETSIPTVPSKTAILKPTSNGKHKNRKACFVCKSLDHLIKDCDYHEKKIAQPTARNHAKKGNHKHYAQMTFSNPQRHVVPIAVLTQSKHVPITVVRPVTTDVPQIKVTRPKQYKPIITKPNLPTRRHINRNLSSKASNSPPRVIAVQAPVGNPQHALKDKEVIDSGCSRHMTGNMSYLSDFEEFNGGYVAIGDNPKGGKIFGKGKIRTSKLDFDDVYFVKELKFNIFSVLQMCEKKNSVFFTDTECLVLSPDFKLSFESQVLLRVHKENNMYNVNLQNIVPSRDLTCLFAKATLDKSILWHRRLGHINFKTMYKLVKGKFDGKVDEGFLVGYSVSSKAFRVFNSRTQIVQETLHVNFLENKPNVVGFQDSFDAEKAREEIDQQYVLFPVWSTGSTNPQNTDGDAAFDEKKPAFEGSKTEFEVNVSPSSNITYSEDEDDVGAEADFNNLETSITFSLIPTTRVHKDHHVTQIIGDLSLATQKRSMVRVAKD
nr:ribonuclease H-like domain-containing protein [Tanacetum cinerariifolium]